MGDTRTLREVRESQGVKLVSIAEHLGISRQTYASYETSPDSMSVAQAKAVCDYLHVDIGDVFFGSKG